jgi:hypothetical protein
MPQVRIEPFEVFEENLADAERLVAFARALLNVRRRRMRRELRDAVGDALGFRQREWDDLDCIESDDVFLVLKPGAGVDREWFQEAQLAPLLRQAIVAISAAVETYVGDKACAYASAALRDRPERLRKLSITFGDLLEVEDSYTRRGWGHRKLLETHLREIASAASSQVGVVFSTVGRKVNWKTLDDARKVAKGATQSQLDELADRRNRIAHEADRKGSGKAAISIDEVEIMLANARSIVEALEDHLAEDPDADVPAPVTKPRRRSSRRRARPRRGAS